MQEIKDLVDAPGFISTYTMLVEKRPEKKRKQDVYEELESLRTLLLGKRLYSSFFSFTNSRLHYSRKAETHHP